MPGDWSSSLCFDRRLLSRVSPVDRPFINQTQPAPSISARGRRPCTAINLSLSRNNSDHWDGRLDGTELVSFTSTEHWTKERYASFRCFEFKDGSIAERSVTLSVFHVKCQVQNKNKMQTGLRRCRENPKNSATINLNYNIPENCWTASVRIFPKIRSQPSVDNVCRVYLLNPATAIFTSKFLH